MALENKKNRCLFGVSLKVIIYDQTKKKFLLVRDSSPESAFSQKYGSWEVPGGHIEESEAMEQALEREVTEEIGADVQYELQRICATRLLPVSGEYTRINVFYLAFYRGGEIKLSDEHVEYRWDSLEAIEKSKEYHEHLKSAFQDAASLAEAISYLDDLRRIKADFENYKKRLANEKNELSSYMMNAVVNDLIPILDNFHMAVEHVPKDKKNDPWVTGITYIEKQFEEVLGKYGVKVMEVKEGERFDPLKHEAIEHSEKEDAKELIVEKVRQKGYLMGDKVVRAAKVNVTSK